MTTRLEKRGKQRFQKQRTPNVTVLSPGALADLRALDDAALAHLAQLRANAWARSPEGTPYGATEAVKGATR